MHLAAQTGLLQEVPVVGADPARLRGIVTDEAYDGLESVAERARDGLSGRVIWNVSSTARGGGVAEMLPSLLGYARFMGVDARWIVIRAEPAFFEITKRLHHNLHGAEGDGGPLGPAERVAYERVLEANGEELAARVGPGDIVILHDPQTLGLASILRGRVRAVVWRSHIGPDGDGPVQGRAWDFLEPDLRQVDRVVVTRRQYAPPSVDPGLVRVIPPSIDPLSPKNQDIEPAMARAILAASGLVDERPDRPATFIRTDGTPGVVERTASRPDGGVPLPVGAPFVFQVSRWDPLKDPVGVVEAFVRASADRRLSSHHLVLAGPDVRGVIDDPEGERVLRMALDAHARLPESLRARIHLVSLPMEDVDENAAIVNALQRGASLVMQKSLREGFGLTVTEAMWKARPVVASAVGGIRDQVVDGESGLLLGDPGDVDEAASAMVRVLGDPGLAARLGSAARERVRQRYLPARHLIGYGELTAELVR